MPFPNFEDHPLHHEGKMQHGYEVYSFPWNDTMIYGVKVGDDFASFTQLKERTLPKVGKVVESMNSKTKQKYAGQMLSFKLRHFLTLHLGLSILLGNVHSLTTENALSKISPPFELFLVNVRTGDVVEWSKEAYEKLTDNTKATEWQVLMKGNTMPFKEHTSFPMSWSGEDRHIWTFGDFFEGLALEDI